MRWNVPITALGVAALAGAMATAAPVTHAHAVTAPGGGHDDRTAAITELRSPPAPPPGLPGEPAGYRAPTGLLTKLEGTLSASAAATPASAKSWGANGPASTLVLYDTTGPYGWLGELYAIGAGNLATHFGSVTAEPVADYVAGQVGDYTATIYLGSTYNEPLPTAFLNDVLATTKPVIWAGDNIWQLSGQPGTQADAAFIAAYGWDPATSYFDMSDAISSVGYKSRTFTRSLDNGAGILAPHIMSQAAVTVLASANCSDPQGAAAACGTIAQTTGDSFPWAISSRNLMYLGEIPFSYISLTDRYLVFADLLFRALAPDAAPRHLALVRLEDISPNSSAANLSQYASYLKSQGVPFSVAVVPQYDDPNGYYNNGIPKSELLTPGSPIVQALQTAIADGGTLIQHGTTHQYSNVDNPFTGVTGDDFEFYRAQCATTAAPPYTFDAPCQNSDYVIEQGPLPGDSQAGTLLRVLTGRALFTVAGLPEPSIWTTPHYAASAADYAGIGTLYQTRYESELFFGGLLTGTAINYGHVLGQFFPYTVHDVYGSTIIPENLGDYEPVELNHNPPRSAQDIVGEAALNLAMTQGVASFFIHPDDDPLAVLQQIVQGIKAAGYTFVSPQALLASTP